MIFALTAGPQLPVGLKLNTTAGLQQYALELQPGRFLFLTLIPAVLAFLIAADRTNDISGMVCRKLKLTQRTTRSSVWSDTFHELRGVVQVELGDGRRVMGWLRFFSDEPEDASLFLEHAAWINEGNELIPINGPGVSITSAVGINYVMFLEGKTESDQKTFAASA